MKFEIICTGWNCEGYIAKCIQSVINQTYQNFHLHLINDGSTDGTGATLNKHTGHPKITVYNFIDNMGAAYRRMNCIRPLDNESVCILLGMDDEMLPGALERIKKEYDNGKLMTYGNWKDQHGGMLPESFALDFDEETHLNRNYRKVLYRSTAPNTFKKFLFNNIPDSDFQLNGKWIDSTTESELMFSCLEMCGKERIGIIKDPIYLYNRNRVGGTLQRTYVVDGKTLSGKDYKYKIYDEIVKREKKPLYVESTEPIVSVGLPCLNAPIAWLAMESLCNQNTPYKWELIVYEDSNDQLGEYFFTKYFNDLKNCERIIYLSTPDRVSLSMKWKGMLNYMCKTSLGLLLQAADCYSEPSRLELTHEYFLQGFDWLHYKRGYFYNLNTDQMILFNASEMATGLNMAISKSALAKCPNEVIWSGVDHWLWKNCQYPFQNFRSCFIESPTWEKGVDTDGQNRISMDRRRHYNNPARPFSKTRTTIGQLVPAEIAAQIKPKAKQEIRKERVTITPHNSFRVLNISSNDWANYSYYNARSLQAVGIEVEGYKLMPHSFGYAEAHPVISKEDMIRKINSGYDIIQIFNSDIMMLHYLTNHKGKVVVYHTGSGYRASHIELNKRFNPVVDKSIIALGEFENLGAKNHSYISVAVDTDKMQPQPKIAMKPYKFLHCPSSPKVKGTDKILKMFAKAHMSLSVKTELLSHEQSWQRMRDCDIYVELFNPEINGDKYGSFGTTAAEAAALGKVVVTQNLSKEVYEKYYGDCPLILAEDESDFIKKIKWLNDLTETELKKLQQAHREWAVEKHSFEATGKRLIKILKPEAVYDVAEA